MISVVLLGFVVAWYGWASQIAGNEFAGTTRFAGNTILHHQEGEARTPQWLLDSTVCPLGKFAWAAWCLALVAAVACGTLRRTRGVFAALLLVTVVLIFVMNLPLAIRSLPAFVAIAFIIVLSGKGKA